MITDEKSQSPSENGRATPSTTAPKLMLPMQRTHTVAIEKAAIDIQDTGHHAALETTGRADTTLSRSAARIERPLKSSSVSPSNTALTDGAHRWQRLDVGRSPHATALALILLP